MTLKVFMYIERLNIKLCLVVLVGSIERTKIKVYKEKNIYKLMTKNLYSLVGEYGFFFFGK